MYNHLQFAVTTGDGTIMMKVLDILYELNSFCIFGSALNVGIKYPNIWRTKTKVH